MKLYLEIEVQTTISNDIENKGPREHKYKAAQYNEPWRMLRRNHF